jgi:hypothetical protein
MVTNLFSIYVPINPMRPLHQIEKVAPQTEQIGTGGVDEIKTGNETGNNFVENSIPQPEKNPKKVDSVVPISGNEESSYKKRKLDPSILDSFLHPKLIKTKTIELSGKTQKHSDESNKKSKTLSHKFSVI